MKKIILTLIFILTAMFGFSQKEEPLHDNAVLIGYIGTSEEDFINVVWFIDNLNNKVIDICQEDGLILLEVCEEWKDVYELMKKIEEEFDGECYYKENPETFFESKCKDRIIKEKRK